MNHDVECRGCGEDMRLDPNHNEKRCVTNKRVTMNTLERVTKAIIDTVDTRKDDYETTLLCL